MTSVGAQYWNKQMNRKQIQFVRLIIFLLLISFLAQSEVLFAEDFYNSREYETDGKIPVIDYFPLGDNQDTEFFHIYVKPWAPVYITHPGLMVDETRWEEVRQDILAGSPDTDRLYSRIVSTANQAPAQQVQGDYNFSTLENNSRIALHAGFVAYIEDDPDYSEKAFDIIASMEVLFAQIGLDQFDQGTIHGGQALVNVCVAYDLLVGFSLVDSTQADQMRNAILTATQKLFNFYVIIPIGKLIQNNHLIKLACGIGMVGLTFPNESIAYEYVNFAMTTAPYVLLEVQMPPGGGQGEGPNYLDYTFRTYLYFIAAYHHLAQGKRFSFEIDCRGRLWPPCKEETVVVNDPMLDYRMEQLLDWRLAISMPNGYGPPIDDSNYSCGYLGPISAMFGRSDYAWLYRNSPRCTENTSSHAVLELAFLNQMPQPQEPSLGPSSFFYEGGQAVLRNNWSDQAHYALINGEHGRARISGLGHEQPDATSFIFYAKGEMLALDSGYRGWDNRWPVIHARNHSLILVDDLGPSIGFLLGFVGVDSYLSEFEDHELFHSVKVDSHYRDADISRRVVLVEDDYFVTAEKVSSNKQRQFAWLLQANAGGTTDGQFTLLSDGALIERPNAVQRTYLQSDSGPIQFIEDEEEHGFHHGADDTHAVLRGEVNAQFAGYLGVHVTADESLNLPDVDAETLQDVLVYTIYGDDYLDLILMKTDSAFTYTPQLSGLGEVESDAELVWLRTDPDTYELVDSYYLGGTYMTYDGQNY